MWGFYFDVGYSVAQVKFIYEHDYIRSSRHNEFVWIFKHKENLLHVKD